MNREQLLSIITSLDTGSLIDMLAAKGIRLADPEAVLRGGEDQGGGLDPWNKTRVQLGDSNRPKLFDQRNIIEPKQPTQKPTVPDFLGDSGMMDAMAYDSGDDGEY